VFRQAELEFANSLIDIYPWKGIVKEVESNPKDALRLGQPSIRA